MSDKSSSSLNSHSPVNERDEENQAPLTSMEGSTSSYRSSGVQDLCVVPHLEKNEKP